MTSANLETKDVSGVPSQLLALLKRWDGGESPWLNINKKFGYMVFTLACVNISTIWIISCLQVRVSEASAKSDCRVSRLLRKLVYLPLSIQILIWSIFMVLLLFVPWYQGVSTTPSYIHFKISLGMLKRSGRIGLALYPMIIFLSLKPNPLPNVLYLHLLPLHKWISRVSTVAIFIHCFGFFGFWVHKNELHKTWEHTMFPGVVTFVLLLFVFILAIKPIREKCYRFFYALHIFTAWASLPMMYIHCMPEANLYIFGSLYLLIYHTAAKIFLSFNIRDQEDENNSFHTISTPGSNLLLVRIPSEKIKRASTKFSREQDGSMLTYFSPGSHIRISPRFINPKSWIFATHPYTIASLDTDEYVDLILKKSHRFACHMASQKYFRYTVSSPFPALDDFFFSRNLKESITVVCGGSGLAFGLPIYKYFYLMNGKVGLENLRLLRSLRLCLVLKDVEDLFVLKEAGIINYQGEPGSTIIQLSPEYEEASIDVFVTGSGGIKNSKAKLRSFLEIFSGAIRSLKRGVHDTQYFEMDDLSREPVLGTDPILEPLRVSSVTSKTSDWEQSDLKVLKPKEGRPILNSLLDYYHMDVEAQASLVLACGPSTLLSDCKSWCNKNHAEFYAESYSI